MSDEITKQEVLAMIEVQTKTAQQMERIANALHNITEEQKSITQYLTNGIADKIITAFSKQCENCNKKITSISSDIIWMKVLIGSISLVITVTMVILKLTGH